MQAPVLTAWLLNHYTYTERPRPTYMPYRPPAPNHRSDKQIRVALPTAIADKPTSGTTKLRLGYSQLLNKFKFKSKFT